jgi:O-antigen/teichoic acid export membrane protein
VINARIRRYVVAPRDAAPRLIGRLRSDSLLRNSLYIMGITIVNSVFGYLFWILAARSRSAHDVGLAAALITAVTLLSILSSKGIGGTLVQMLGRCAPGRPWSLVLNAGLLAGALCGALAGAIAVLALPAWSGKFAILLRNPVCGATFVLGVVMWNLADLTDAACVAERAAGRSLARNAAAAILKVASLLACMPLAWSGTLGVFGASMLGCAAGTCVGLILVRRLGRGYATVFRGVVGQARRMLSSAVANHLIIVSAVGPTYLLPALVTARLSATDNAYFYTTWMVCGVFFLISPAVAAALFAEAAHTAQPLGDTLASAARIITVLLAPTMVGAVVGGHAILSIFGTEYARHGLPLLIVLVISAVPDAITNLYVAALRARNRLREAATLNMGMAVLTLLLAWFLLPALGIAGAGWAWLIAQTAGSLLAVAQMLGTVRHRSRVRP